MRALKTRRFYYGGLLLILIAPFLVAARGPSTPPAPATPAIQTVGASVMLRLQREGAPVYDFRKSGQPIPGAIRVTRSTRLPNASPLVLIGDGVLGRAKQTIQQDPQTRVYLVPAKAVDAYPDFQNVEQIAPRAAFDLMKKSGAPVFDFAEHEEFDYARVPGSTRIAWTQVLQNDWSALQKRRGKTVILICPVGSRSQIAAQKLQRAGVRVLNVRGGMFAWQNAKLPVEGEITRRSTDVSF